MHELVVVGLYILIYAVVVNGGAGGGDCGRQGTVVGTAAGQVLTTSGDYPLGITAWHLQ